MSMPNPKRTAVRVQKVRLYPDVEMKQVLDELCDYRRYCWNEALALWNDMYEQSLILDDRKSRPSEYKVRNELVSEKQDWQYALSARVLQLEGAAHPVDVFYASASRFITAFSSLSMTAPHS